MKRILFLLYIGFGVVAGGHAQTDVTTRYVKNASMESGFKNWTNEGLQLQSNTDFAYKTVAQFLEAACKGLAAVDLKRVNLNVD